MEEKNDRAPCQELNYYSQLDNGTVLEAQNDPFPSLPIFTSASC